MNPFLLTKVTEHMRSQANLKGCSVADQLDVQVIAHILNLRDHVTNYANV